MKDIYIIQHEILQTLIKVGFTITKSGSEEKGHNAIYKFNLSSASLQFGMLVALMTDFDEYSKHRPFQSVFINQMKIKKEEIGKTKYEWEDVSMAIEGLTFSEDVADNKSGSLVEEDREIRLTRKGYNSCISNFYLKQSEKEEYTKLLRTSTVETEKAIKITGQATVRLYWATLAIAFVTLLSIAVPFFTDKEKNELKFQLKAKDTLVKSMQRELLQAKNAPILGTTLKDSLKKK